MGEIITAIILILLATMEARFPTLLAPSVFLGIYILWVLKSKMRTSHIIALSFALGIVLDAIDTSHVWIYPFLMSFASELILQIKQKVNLTLSPLRIILFTAFVFFLFLPLLLYYNLAVGFVFLRSVFTAILIEGALIVLWRGELS